MTFTSDTRWYAMWLWNVSSNFLLQSNRSKFIKSKNSNIRRSSKTEQNCLDQFEILKKKLKNEKIDHNLCKLLNFSLSNQHNKPICISYDSAPYHWLGTTFTLSLNRTDHLAMKNQRNCKNCDINATTFADRYLVTQEVFIENFNGFRVPASSPS